MKMKNYIANFFALTIVVLLQLSSISANPLDKMKTEELLANHLKSIGSEEARSSVKSLIASGTAKAVIRGRNAGETSGLLVMASEGDKNLIGMRFNNNDYPYEKMGFDGEEFTVGFVQPGQRSILGSFMRLNEETFKYGILGGVLSTSWELLDYDEKTGKLKCSGTKEIDDVDHYKCRYQPKRSDLKITYYFNAKNFRHTRTEYTRVISGGQGLSVDNSARQNETRYKMVEDFSDFKEVNNLTLPHKYVLAFEMLTGNGTTDMEWTMNIEKVDFNQQIDAKQFKVDTF